MGDSTEQNYRTWGKKGPKNFRVEKATGLTQRIKNQKDIRILHKSTKTERPHYRALNTEKWLPPGSDDACL